MNVSTALRRLYWRRRRRLLTRSLRYALIPLLAGAATLLMPEELSFYFPIAPLVMPLFVICLTICAGFIVFTAMPDRRAFLDNLGELGDPEKLAADLEEDLSQGAFLYHHGGVCITRRFILDTRGFRFRLYPLEGLARYDESPGLASRNQNAGKSQSTPAQSIQPVFYYTNGAIRNVETSVPFAVLKPYITELDCVASDTPSPVVSDNPAHEQSAYTVPTGKQPSAMQKKSDKTLWLAVFVFVAGLLLAANGRGDNLQWITRSIPVIMVAGVVLGMAFLCIRSYARHKKIMARLERVDGMDAKIRELEAMEREGYYKNARPNYLNQLSIIYHNADLNEQALSCLEEARALQAGVKERLLFRTALSFHHVFDLNAALYLIYLNRLDAAKHLLARLDGVRAGSQSFKLTRAYHHALLAIAHSDPQTARTYLSCEPRNRNLRYYRLLLLARCDLLEGKNAAAASKLKEIIMNCRYSATVNRARTLLAPLENEPVTN